MEFSFSQEERKFFLINKNKTKWNKNIFLSTTQM